MRQLDEESWSMIGLNKGCGPALCIYIYLVCVSESSIAQDFDLEPFYNRLRSCFWKLVLVLSTRGQTVILGELR